MRKIIAIISAASVLFAFACKMPAKKDNGTEKKFFTTTVANISFIFPQDSFAYHNREKLMAECRDAVKSDIKMVKFPSFTDSITIQFVSSREEMKKYTGLPASGVIGEQPKKTIYLLDNVKENGPPIKHELMHMITFCAWGNPDPTSIWMNEGLAAYSQNECNSYNDEQIYRFLLEDKMLLPMNSLAADFYREPEMIAYHQCAFIAQYLLANYGIEKFKELWMQGLANFETIYGKSFAQVKLNIDKTAQHDYPNAPPIDWKTFEEGCN
jgi:hypothetical protein